MGLSFFGALALGLCVFSASLRAEDIPVPTETVSIALATRLEHAKPTPDLWTRIRAGFTLAESNPELVRRHEQQFLDHPAYLERAVRRSRYYLFHIADEVHKRGMPMELALLPIIESAYNPMALSNQKASGIWQFIPSTGKVFGLDQNAWFDGRRDIVESTRAALDYLQTLYQTFGDWELALAAYNCGEGCVQRAQDRGHDSSYAKLRLPKETRNYVPRLIAVRNIIRDPEKYGFKLESVPDESYFMRVTLTKPMEARKVAELAEIDLEDFLALNPAFQRNVIYTESRDVLLLPTDHVETFQFNLHRQGLDRAYLQTYVAKKGENASNIASHFGVSLDWLKEHNPLKLWRGKVTQPQRLLVPNITIRAISGKAEQNGSSSRTHTVRKGDTLLRLAQLYRVKIDDLRRLNEAVEPLKPGATLTIPVSEG